MTQRARTVALAAGLCGALALSSSPAWADSGSGGSGSGSGSGGAGLGTTTTTTTTSSASPTAGGSAGSTGADEPAAPQITATGTVVSASGNGYTLSSTATGMLRRRIIFSGSVSPQDSGDTMAIQRQAADGRWEPAASATVAPDGSFEVPWRASVRGVVQFRASLEAPAGTAAAADAAVSSPGLTVTIYTPSIATIYGPGFYGHRTACGQRLGRETLGVASRTLPCGTDVSISWHGESIIVPVIDRGPYANGATWDLTSATAAALGDPGTATVGAAVL